MPDPKPQAPEPPAALEYQSQNKTPPGFRVSRKYRWQPIVVTSVLVSIIGGLVTTRYMREQAERNERQYDNRFCYAFSAQLLEYSNQHNGKYPDSFSELLLATNMSPQCFCSPESDDTPAEGTREQMAAALTAGGHLSYVYLAKGLSSDCPDDTILAYEPLGKHCERGMRVLYGDYHIGKLSAAEANKFVASIVPGKPARWPPPGAN